MAEMAAGMLDAGVAETAAGVLDAGVAETAEMAAGIPVLVAGVADTEAGCRCGSPPSPSVCWATYSLRVVRGQVSSNGCLHLASSTSSLSVSFPT